MQRQKIIEELQGQLDGIWLVLVNLFEQIARERPEIWNRMYNRLMIMLDEDNLSKIVSVQNRLAYGECESALSEAASILADLVETRDGD